MHNLYKLPNHRLPLLTNAVEPDFRKNRSGCYISPYEK
jgi:hypothetical protein